MKVLLTSFLLVLFVGLFQSGKEGPKNNPKFLKQNSEWKRVGSSKEAFKFKNPDKSIEHQMMILLDENNLPLLYYADIQTPVCIDGLCKPVFIELYWDLLGEYAGFGIYPEKPLTKYDHDLFEDKDYEILHKLLSDESSVIGKRRLSQLYDNEKTRTETIKFKGVEIDGLTGATKLEIKESIVEGGLYSCYKLWYLANRSIEEGMRDNFATIYSDSLMNYFLNSNIENYQYYALKNIESTKYAEHLDLIIEVLKVSSPLTRSYLLKKMPKDLFARPQFVKEIYTAYSDLDFNSRTLLLRHLENSTSEAATILSTKLNEMSENQVKTYLTALDKPDNIKASELRKNLIEYSKGTESSYAYLVDSYLKQGQ